MDKECDQPQKEVLNMPNTVTKNESINIKSSLKKISSRLQVLEGEKNKIKLNPKNKLHKEWFEDDGVK